eukprot:PhF_6_TR26374/c0_g1_i1/m.38023/K15503/ANKRD44; serine/threonine-protein phosphatase 6 regulatory ankyrin repeat subunit B
MKMQSKNVLLGIAALGASIYLLRKTLLSSPSRAPDTTEKQEDTAALLQERPTTTVSADTPAPSSKHDISKPDDYDEQQHQPTAEVKEKKKRKGVVFASEEGGQDHKHVSITLVKEQDMLNPVPKGLDDMRTFLKSSSVTFETFEKLLPTATMSTESGRSLLHDVSQCVLSPEVPKFLETILKSPNAPSVNGVDVADGGVTPLHVASAVGNKAAVEYLVTVPGIQVNAVTETSWTPLHVASASGHVDVVDVLLRNHADPLALNNRKSASLHLAVTARRHAVIKRLMEDSKVTVTCADDSGATPLHLCGLGGNVMLETAEALLKAGAEVDAVDKDGRTALHWALQRGHGRLTLVLLSHGARADIGDTKFGVSALHLAAAANDDGILQHILNDKRLDVNVPDVEQRTPLAVACMKGAANAVTALLAHGAKPDTPGMTARKESPLLWAIHNNHKAIARQLISSGANLTIVDTHGNTPLALACNKPRKTFTRIIEDIVEKAPDTVNHRDNQGRAPLHWVALMGDVEALSTLLEAGAVRDPRTTDEDGVLPLHWAAGSGQYDVLESLIIEGELNNFPDWVNEIDAQRRTPLHWACVKATPDTPELIRCIELLVKKGARPDEKDKQGRTPRSMLSVHFILEDVKKMLTFEEASSPW